MDNALFAPIGGVGEIVLVVARVDGRCPFYILREGEQNTGVLLITFWDVEDNSMPGCAYFARWTLRS